MQPRWSASRTENHPARLCEAIMAACGIGDPRDEAAFAAMAREAFLGPGPRQIVRRGGGYRTIPDPDLVYLYTDDVIGHLAGAPPNNGAVHHADMRVCAKFCRSAGGELGIEFDRCHPPRESDQLRPELPCSKLDPVPTSTTCSPG